MLDIAQMQRIAAAMPAHLRAHSGRTCASASCSDWSIERQVVEADDGPS